MGSKEGAAPPPSTVCCMCGDRGLTQELFQCKVCLVRSQHNYCSDLFPKAESYGACNWCLREQGVKPLPKDTTIKDSNNTSISSSSNSIGGINSGSGVKIHRRGVFSSQFNKPIKRPRPPLDRSASDVSAGQLSQSLGRARQVFRGKVRRYKLLEEFSS